LLVIEIGDILMSESLKNLLSSYGRHVLGAAIALYGAGVTDPVDLLNALWAALLPVAIRYVNPNDKSFGRMPESAEVKDALAKAKAPVKKSKKVI
jgi:hypothetical protein